MTETTEAIPVFKRRPKTVLAIFVVSIVAVILGAGEWILRYTGYLPAREYFKLTEKLTVQEMFVTDEQGVFRASKQYWAPVADVSINSNGFRGPEFSPPDPGQKSVLILGDSHAFGIGASPFSKAFPDLIRDKGYRVYNTGIPGVDPNQYKLIADLYMPKLKPDYVIVAFYVGNDFVQKLYPVVPNHNFLHVTNAGWLLGFDACNKPLTAQEAYDYYIGTSEPLVARLLLSTSIGTAVWNLATGSSSRAPAASQPRACADGSHQVEQTPTNPVEATVDILRHIQVLATKHASQFYLLVIPTRGNGCSPQLRDLGSVREKLDELNPIYLDDIPEAVYFDAPNCHIQNAGHQFIADRVLSRLQ